jgi:hypothetical protein
MTARSDHSDLTTCDWTDEFCDCRDLGTIYRLITEESSVLATIGRGWRNCRPRLWRLASRSQPQGSAATKKGVSSENCETSRVSISCGKPSSTVAQSGSTWSRDLETATRLSGSYPGRCWPGGRSVPTNRSWTCRGRCRPRAPYPPDHSFAPSRRHSG